MQPRSRRVQRIHLPQPLPARLGTIDVAVVDVSLSGARVEHRTPLTAGVALRLSFCWNDSEISIACRIVRSRVERFSIGSGGAAVFHSGLEFESSAASSSEMLKAMIASFITRALQEQKLNARGVLPQHDAARMPIFRFGQLTADGAHDVGYVSYSLENRNWRKKRTHDPGQPLDGFTISANEDHSQAELLCRAYETSDRDGRRMIQLFARLSIAENEGAQRGRFDP